MACKSRRQGARATHPACDPGQRPACQLCRGFPAPHHLVMHEGKESIDVGYDTTSERLPSAAFLSSLIGAQQNR
jgi:hypothetical protein